MPRGKSWTPEVINTLSGENQEPITKEREAALVEIIKDLKKIVETLKANPEELKEYLDLRGEFKGGEDLTPKDDMDASTKQRLARYMELIEKGRQGGK